VAIKARISRGPRIRRRPLDGEAPSMHPGGRPAPPTDR
jgi:hypothetical protein